MIINHCLVNLKQNLRKIHKYIYRVNAFLKTPLSKRSLWKNWK